MNWDTIARHYAINFRAGADDQLDWFRRQTSLHDAVVIVARAIDGRGKRFRHQTRIKRAALAEAERLLLENVGGLAEARSFHELWLLIERVLSHVAGLGELYVYDTALRIGAYRNLLPDRVYLHAGTRTGAKRFGLNTRNRRWLDVSMLPFPLRDLPAQEIEDILCIYKSETLSAAKSCAEPLAGCERPRVRNLIRPEQCPIRAVR